MQNGAKNKHAEIKLNKVFVILICKLQVIIDKSHRLIFNVFTVETSCGSHVILIHFSSILFYLYRARHFLSTVASRRFIL